ncbi:transposase [Kibdelosporangium banguiense]|uniref:Transposase n=1 Tax=Kibdelosporangium banguiense TaxID=1365924 RepID=A0ABS4TF11_9PSEU|nr:transposase [Kibdelosporangium banguiense]MBP2322670.1 transposase [Kibdelosporangium banguiense]
MKFEPLADYLEPRLGNIYADNLIADDGFVEYRPWDPELEQAVKQYLVHEVTDEEYDRFIDMLYCAVPDGSREEQAAAILKQQLPWEVADAFHWAAVKAVPTLSQLIGDRDAWEDGGQQDDAQVWMEVHASEDQLVELAQYMNPTVPVARGELSWWHPALELKPAQLLKAWHHVVGPAASDFTDAEWELLTSCLPLRKDAYGRVVDRRAYNLTQRRRSYNGIRYRFANKIPWNRIPRRYGATGGVYMRYFLDMKNGLFANLMQSLRVIPEAANLVEWLKQMTVENRR